MSQANLAAQWESCLNIDLLYHVAYKRSAVDIPSPAGLLHFENSRVNELIRISVT